jgi:hypothetical protein
MIFLTLADIACLAGEPAQSVRVFLPGDAGPIARRAGEIPIKLT